MPHKRNPEECEQVVTLAGLVQAQLCGYLSSPDCAHERDFRRVRMEWLVVPEAANYCSRAAALLHETLEMIEFCPRAMRANTDKVLLQLYSEKLMFVLGERVGKNTAYDLLSEIFERAAREDCDPLEACRADPLILEHLGLEGLDEMMDLRSNKSQVGRLLDRILGGEEEAHS